MAPLIHRLDQAEQLDVRLCVTAQHRHMLDQVLGLFDLRPHYDLDLMQISQNLYDITASVLAGLGQILQEWRPDRVLIHGDTTTTLAAALAAYYEKIPVGHVEAGLRTGNIYAPWPEEVNRRVADVICDEHFAPTEKAKQNLLAENINEARISVTGNTVIDALEYTLNRLLGNKTFMAALDNEYQFLNSDKHLILVTGHRRESFGTGFNNICQALALLAARSDLEILYPVHLNPNVQRPVRKMLGGRPGIHLIEPLDYERFVYLMHRSHIVLTDSGGVQEEAPSLGKPILVMRDITERPEAVEAGTALIVGTDTDRIVKACERLLDDPHAYQLMAQAANPYGDGKASERILARILDVHK